MERGERARRAPDGVRKVPETRKNRREGRAPGREQKWRRKRRGHWGPICSRWRALDRRTEDEVMRMEVSYLEGLSDTRAVGRDLLGVGEILPCVIAQLRLPHRVMAARRERCQQLLGKHSQQVSWSEGPGRVGGSKCQVQGIR